MARAGTQMNAVVLPATDGRCERSQGVFGLSVDALGPFYSIKCQRSEQYHGADDVQQELHQLRGVARRRGDEPVQGGQGGHAVVGAAGECRQLLWRHRLGGLGRPDGHFPVQRRRALHRRDAHAAAAAGRQRHVAADGGRSRRALARRRAQNVHEPEPQGRVSLVVRQDLDWRVERVERADGVQVGLHQLRPRGDRGVRAAHVPHAAQPEEGGDRQRAARGDSVAVRHRPAHVHVHAASGEDDEREHEHDRDDAEADRGPARRHELGDNRHLGERRRDAGDCDRVGHHPLPGALGRGRQRATARCSPASRRT
jgi:hypothetical protein